MKISENTIKEIVNARKDILSDSISSLIPSIKLLIDMIESNEQISGNNVKLPNIAITANNKLIELEHEFERAGISFFIEPNSVASNTVGDAIIQEMIDLVDNGINNLDIHEVKATDIIQSKMQKVDEIENYGPIKKFFFKTRCFLNPGIIHDIMYYTEEEKEQLNAYLEEYIKLDDKLFSYNLRDNVVESLVAFITAEEEKEQGFLEDSAVRSLEKLGLKDVIPEFKTKLRKSKEQPSQRKSWELTPEEMDAVAKIHTGINDSSDKSVSVKADKEHE